MTPDSHRQIAERIVASMGRCTDRDYEALIEGAMLAGTHWVNAALHTRNITSPETDVVHTYMLTANEFQLYRVAAGPMLDALAEIERVRPLYVRGDVPGGAAAARRAQELLLQIRDGAASAVGDANA
jgi:hypothetical protein